MFLLRVLACFIAVQAIHLYHLAPEEDFHPLRLVAYGVMLAALVLSDWIGDREEKRGRGW